MAPILLVTIGSILIGFNYFDKIAHLVILITILPVNIVSGSMRAASELFKRPKCKPIMKKGLRIVKILLFMIPASLILIWSILLILLSLLSKLPVLINEGLNKYFIWQLRSYKLLMFPLFKLSPKLVNHTNEELSTLFEKMRVPFIALIGLVLFIIGSIFQLVEIAA